MKDALDVLEKLRRERDELRSAAEALLSAVTADEESAAYAQLRAALGIQRE
jgi:hypothetical protein